MIPDNDSEVSVVPPEAVSSRHHPTLIDQRPPTRVTPLPVDGHLPRPVPPSCRLACYHECYVRTKITVAASTYKKNETE